MELVNTMRGGVAWGEDKAKSIKRRSPAILGSKEDRARLKLTVYAKKSHVSIAFHKRGGRHTIVNYMSDGRLDLYQSLSNVKP